MRYAQADGRVAVARVDHDAADVLAVRQADVREGAPAVDRDELAAIHGLVEPDGPGQGVGDGEALDGAVAGVAVGLLAPVPVVSGMR